MQEQTISQELVDKYDVKASYFTAYPPTGVWPENFNSADFVNVLKNIDRKKEEGYPLNLYVHFPFCHYQCYFCQCYQSVTYDKVKIRKALQYLMVEIDLIKKIFEENSVKSEIKEVHLGGGTPSILDPEDFDKLVEKLGSLVTIKNLDEFAMEIDPRTVTKDKIKYFASKGINRISFGVQDFDPKVQKAVNRINSFELIQDLSSHEIRKLFKGLNFDLIYGMPYQTRETWKKTIELVLQIFPDRLAVSNLGYRPDIFPHNRLIKESDLPNALERYMMWEDTLELLTKGGYVRVGRDHFAKSGDDLGKAVYNRTLHRNTMGYTPGRSVDTIGIGPSSLTRIHDYYFQKAYDLEKYYKVLAEGEFPIIRGYHLNKSDLIRRSIMFKILSYFKVNFKELEDKYNIDFRQYFKNELDSGKLKDLINDKLVVLTPEGLEATNLGRSFLRNICYVFDNSEGYEHNIAYIKDKQEDWYAKRADLIPLKVSSVKN